MLRENTLEEISDGKLYQRDDLVKANCGGCKGCSSCCHNMGDTVVLDPYDLYQLTTGLQINLQTLLSTGITLSVIDGLILPHLKTVGEDNACYYLSEEGRCRIHEFRPGICRLFPLGRYYHEDTFSYILQIGECKNENRSKIKVKQWLEVPELKQYEKYILTWHNLLKETQSAVLQKEQEGDREIRQKVCTALLQMFYLNPYEEENFYTQFENRQNLFFNMWKK